MGEARRRRPLRARISLDVEVRGARQSFPAETRDLSVEGACLSSPIRLATGDRAGLSILVEGVPPLSLPFEVRWEKPLGSSTLLGTEFIHTPATRKSLQKLLWEIESGAVRGANALT